MLKKIKKGPKMKIYILPVLLTALLSPFFAAGPVSSAENKVVAKVGDISITESELAEALNRFKPASVYHNVGTEKMEKFKKDALNELIDIELFHKEAKKRGVKISKSAIDEVVEANITRLGSKKKMNEALTKKGISMEDFKEEIRKHQMVLTLLNDLAKEAEYKDEELRRYYEDNKSKFKRPEGLRLYHILVKVEPGATEEEWEKRRLDVEEILRKIKSGEDFGDTAYNYSEDPYKFKSGDLGFVHKGQLEKEIEDAAFSLKEGELSGVIRSIYGFHIIKAGERKPEAIVSFDEIKEKTRKELNGKRLEEKKKELLDRLRKEYPVEIYIKIDG